MRFFLDTNVIASGTYVAGNEAKLIQALARRSPAPVTSSFVLRELEKTFREKFGHSESDAAAAVDEVRQWAEIVPEGQPIDVGPTTDRPVLAAAVSAHVDFLVTGDRGLLHLKRVSTTAIVRAADALRILGV